jgi:hypothetical protein
MSGDPVTKDEIQRKEEDDFEHYFNGCIRLSKRVNELEAVLNSLIHGYGDDGPCWCAYTQIMHPPHDPHDGVELYEGGHTFECVQARKIMKVKITGKNL